MKIFLLALLFSLSLLSTGQSNLVKNPSFTNGLTEWNHSGSWNSGTYTGYNSLPNYAWFANSSGQADNNLYGTLSQSIALPSCLTNFNFRFYYKITSEETTTTNGWDILNASVFNSNNVIIKQLVLSNLDKVLDNGAYRLSDNIVIPSAYSGQTIKIVFTGSTDNAKKSAFRIDDVEVVQTANPDLIIVDTSISARSVNIGSSITVYCKERNVGVGYADPNVVDYILSSDNKYDLGTDVNLSSIFIDPVICSNYQTNVLSKTLLIPSINPNSNTSIQPGQYNILIRANATGIVSGDPVGNNIIAIPIFLTTPCTPVSATAPLPSTNSICLGGNISLSVTAFGTLPYTYQWQKNGSNLTNGTTFQTVTSPTLKIQNIAKTDEGSYTCVVKGCNGTQATPSPYQLVVTSASQPPPSATISATGTHNISVGESITFSSLIPYVGYSYKWFFQGGTPASSQLQTQNVSYALAGTYQVSLSLTNTCGQNTTSLTPAGFITVKANKTQASQVTPKTNIVNSMYYPTGHEADPVKIPTLDYGYSASILSMNAIGGALDFKVYYNSNNNDYASNLGLGWSHDFDYKIKNEGDSIWRVSYAEGYDVPFVKLYNGNGSSFPLYAGIFEKLSFEASSNKYSLSFKSGAVYYFESVSPLDKQNYRLDYIKDRNNNLTNLDYDISGNLIKITAQGGRYWTFTNNNAGKIVSITDLANRQVQFNYIGSDLIGLVDPDQGETKFEYDGSHLMTKVINPEGNLLLQNVYTNGKVTTQYDVFGRATNFYSNTPSESYTKVVFPDNSFKVYQSDNYYRIIDEQDEEGHHIKQQYYIDNIDSVYTDKNGNVTTFDKDTVGNITAVHRPLNVNDYVEYGTFSLPIKVTDGEGYITKHRYDNNGNEVETILPDSTHVLRFFDNTGQLLFEQNEIYTIVNSYNAQGDLSHIKTPTGNIDILTNAIGWDSVSVNQSGQRTSKLYNGRGLQIQFVDVDGKSVYTSYDKNGNKITFKDKLGYVTRFLFDSKDRPYATLNYRNDTLERKFYDDRDFIIATKAANGALTKVFNNKIGIPIKTVNALGGEINIVRDNNGNIISTTDAVTNVSTVNSYDALNRNYSSQIGSLTSSKVYLKNSWVKSTTNARNLTTSFINNARGNITDVEDPDHIHTIVGYNKLQSQISLKDPNGNTTKIFYDTANRPITYSDALLHTDNKTLDNLSRETLLTKANGVTVVTNYNALGLTSTISYSTGEKLSFTYNDNGKIKSASGPLGISYFEYDSSDYPKKYTDPFNNEINYRYDISGNLLSVQYQKGQEVTYTYNKLNLITDIIDWKSGIYHHDYDAAGRLLKTSYPNKMYCEYKYDNNGYVILKAWYKRDGSVLYSDTITRSSWGDIKSIACGKCYPKIQGSTTYTANYDAANQIISDDKARHFFDYSGNDTLIKGDSSSLKFNYTANNVLKSFTTDNQQTVFGYDALFSRVQRIENGKKILYVNNGGLGLSNVLIEQDNLGVSKAWNIYSSELLSRIDSNGKSTYYISDIKHNIVALTDDTENITDRYIYDENGKLWKQTGATNQPYTWLGAYGVQRENDSLYYVRARYFDANCNRFLNKDPFDYNINDPQSINRYSYALNNWTNVFDYTGLFGNKDNSVRNPGFWESLIPVWGNLQSAKYQYSTGNIHEGDIYGAFSLLDVALLPVSELAALKKVATAAKASTSLVPKGIIPLGEWGEAMLAKVLNNQGGKEAKSYATSLGRRYFDRIVDGVAHEAKAGLNAKLTKSIEKQVLKDVELIQNNTITKSVWHFFQGADEKLINFLDNHGIDHMIHDLF